MKLGLHQALSRTKPLKTSSKNADQLLNYPLDCQRIIYYEYALCRLRAVISTRDLKCEFLRNANADLTFGYYLTDYSKICI